jgi:hypothetical protein
MGVTLTELGGWSGGYVVDETNSLDVELDSGSLASVTRDQMLNGEQVAIIGNEVVPFQRAELIAPNQYRLSGLLRGARGTEDHISEHTVGERFVLISAANWYRIDALLSTVGNEYLYKPVTFGKSLESVTADAFTNTARGLLPFSPVDARAARASSGTTTLTWKRRTRLSTRMFGTVPLGEASEAYEVDVFTNDTFTTQVRTLATTAPSVAYTAAQQETDFGSVQAALHVKIYQISESVGRGLPLTATLGADSGVDSFTADTLNPNPKVLLSAGDEWLVARDGTGNATLGFYTYATDLNYAAKVSQSTTNPYLPAAHIAASDPASKKFVLLMRGSANASGARKLFYGTLPGGPGGAVPAFMPANPPVGLWWTGSEFRALLADNSVWSSPTGASWTSEGASSGLPAYDDGMNRADVVKIGAALSLKDSTTDSIYFCADTDGLAWSAATGDIATPPGTYTDYFSPRAIASNGSRGVLVVQAKVTGSATVYGLVYTSTDGEDWSLEYEHDVTGSFNYVETFGSDFITDIWPPVPGSDTNDSFEVLDFGDSTLSFAYNATATAGKAGATKALTRGTGTTGFDSHTVYSTANLITFTPLDWDDA